jgi:hypothetical protein
MQMAPCNVVWPVDLTKCDGMQSGVLTKYDGKRTCHKDTVAVTGGFIIFVCGLSALVVGLPSSLLSLSDPTRSNQQRNSSRIVYECIPHLGHGENGIVKARRGRRPLSRKSVLTAARIVGHSEGRGFS